MAIPRLRKVVGLLASPNLFVHFHIHFHNRKDSRRISGTGLQKLKIGVAASNKKTYLLVEQFVVFRDNAPHSPATVLCVGDVSIGQRAALIDHLQLVCLNIKEKGRHCYIDLTFSRRCCSEGALP